LKVLVERIGHHLVVDDTIWGRYNGDRSPRDLSVTREQREQLLNDRIIKPFKPSPCTAGAVKVKVDAEGGVSTCELLPVTFGDVNEKDLISIWSSPEMSGYSETTIEISDRRRLEGALALACPGLNVLATGDRRG
jgi:MoaA/NifB/PqqE/SkfB family radical SAM enzyme